MIKKKPKAIEDAQCISFVQELELRIKTDKRLKGLKFYHIPNGGMRNVIIATKLKRMGTLKGVSDYFIMRASRGYHGLYIEFKALTKDYKGKVSPEQKQFISDAINEGYKAVVVWGASQAIEEVYKYLEIKLRNVLI